jgi:hypothetical protein
MAPVAAVIATGVARASAQGQVTISTATAIHGARAASMASHASPATSAATR